MRIALRDGHELRVAPRILRLNEEAIFDLYAANGERDQWVCANITKDEARQIRDALDEWLRAT